MDRLLPVQRWLRGMEHFRVELVLIPCSAWAAYCLWSPPSNFAAFPSGWHLAEQLLPTEWAWGILAAVASAAKLAGLLLACMHRLAMLSIGLRCLGLGLSGTFWFLIGLSTIIGNSDSLYAPISMLVAISAWWVLFRLPSVPGQLE